MGWYEVALWMHFRGGTEMPYWDDAVEAESAFEAILCLMVRYQLRRVAHASVRCVSGGSIERWKMGRDFWVKVGR